MQSPGCGRKKGFSGLPDGAQEAGTVDVGEEKCHRGAPSGSNFQIWPGKVTLCFRQLTHFVAY